MPLLFPASLLLLLAAGPGDPFRDISFDDARAAAEKEKKLVVVDFQSAQSEASKRFEKLTIPSSGVRSFLKTKVVAIRVDLASAGELAARFRVETAPTVLFVDALGLEVDRYVGYLEPQRFLDQARGTLAGKDGIARARAKIAAGEKDPRVRLELAQLLIDRGRNAEALEELLVCFDRGAIDDPKFAETRSTEVLERIHRLGQVWPDALAKLAERSDAAAKRIVEGSTDPRDVDAAIRIDEALGRVDRLLKLYDRLKAMPEAAEVRKQLAPHVVVVLMADRRYAEALECIGDPAAEVEKKIAACAEVEKKGAAQAEAARSCRRDVVGSGAACFEALLGTGQTEKADALLNRLLAFEPKLATYETLMNHTMRVGARKKAIEIGWRGVADLPAPEDKARLREVLAALPEK
jgi:thioredoxin-like negative regulator of GroEL